jgi:hypothetical protein
MKICDENRYAPTAAPATAQPLANPTTKPIANPTTKPIANPTGQPIANPTTQPIATPTAQPTKYAPIFCPGGPADIHLYNKSISIENRAVCQISPDCHFENEICVGTVAVNNVGASQDCGTVNPGIKGECDGHSEGQKEYCVLNDTPCYFKKGQSNKSYFNVCSVSCGLEQCFTGAAK